MFDTIAKRLILVNQIPSSSIPGRGDTPISDRTLGHWCLRGVRGIRLESLKVQGKRYTTIEAWDRFFRAVTKAAAATNRGRPATVSRTAAIQTIIPGNAQMAEGTIKRLTDRGFGFIDTGKEKDLFFHSSSLQGVSFEKLREGQKVSYTEGRGPKGPCAENVKPV